MIKHIPVLLEEALAGLAVIPQAWYLDATFGRGGHTQAILNQGGFVIAFDVDQAAIAFGQNYYIDALNQGKLILVPENFDQLGRVLTGLRQDQVFTQLAGALFDFGTSTEQLTSSERGFSFIGDGQLDMRMDQRLGVQAKDLLMVLSEKQLSQLFQTYGGEAESRAIARAIVKTRSQDPGQLTTVQGLVQLISRIKRRQPKTKLHPATKVFQALRIVVNDELSAIERGLDQLWQFLTPEARVVTIAFHEGEDRIAKHRFRSWQEQGLGEVLTKHPITPSDAEVTANARSRSAKLRIFKKN